MIRIALVALVTSLTLCSAARAQTTQPTAQQVPAAQRMQAEATAMHAMMESDLGRAFLDGAASLPSITTRTIHREKKSRQWFSESEMKARLAADATLEFEAAQVDEDRYYDTKYGSPVAYARPFDLLGQALEQRGRRDFAGMKILDFGYGTIGHLRMLASQGADVTGLDVDSFLTALYSDPTDTGVITGNSNTHKDGRITLVSGRFNDPKIGEQVGGDYDLIISKNTLKRGYVKPPEGIEVDKRMLIDLGVDDATFLKTLYDALKPGGHLLIYNICPKQNDYQKEGGGKYLPMADGLCPWPAKQLEAIGFKPVIIDRDDSEACRRMARILGWDQGDTGGGAMDVENDLFAHYTLLAKPAR